MFVGFWVSHHLLPAHSLAVAEGCWKFKPFYQCQQLDCTRVQLNHQLFSKNQKPEMNKSSLLIANFFGHALLKDWGPVCLWIFQVNLEMACLTESQRCWREFPVSRCIQWLKKQMMVFTMRWGWSTFFFLVSTLHPVFFWEALRIDSFILSQGCFTTLKLRLLNSEIPWLSFISFISGSFSKSYAFLRNFPLWRPYPRPLLWKQKLRLRSAAAYSPSFLSREVAKTHYCILWVWPPPSNSDHQDYYLYMFSWGFL